MFSQPSEWPAAPASWWLCLLLLALGCDSKLVVGTWSCPLPPSSVAGAGASGIMDGTVSDLEASAANRDIPEEWSTGFEDGFCDYRVAGGSCYSHPANSLSSAYKVVERPEPVHSGRHAAAFRVESGHDIHTRCFLQGRLPKQATYGAWYYVPSVAQSSGNWNLLHFRVHRRSSAEGAFDNTWDVSLNDDETGDLRLIVGPSSLSEIQGQSPSVPIGEWFHIEVYLKLAADATGEIAVSLNGTRFAGGSDIATDLEDSEWGQWFVGNLAEALEPPSSTVYVDDVSIRPTR